MYRIGYSLTKVVGCGQATGLVPGSSHASESVKLSQHHNRESVTLRKLYPVLGQSRRVAHQAPPMGASKEPHCGWPAETDPVRPEEHLHMCWVPSLVHLRLAL